MKLTIFAATGGVGRQALEQAVAAGHDVTAVRPPRLTDKPLTGTYRTAHGQNPRRGLRVSRADVAHRMLRVLEQPETIRQAIGIAY
jgi:putative NADH-flavin reductase